MSTQSDDKAAAELLEEVMALPVPERSAKIAALLRERKLTDERGQIPSDFTLQDRLRRLFGKPTFNQLNTLRAGLNKHGLLERRGNTIYVLLPAEKETSVPGSTASNPAPKPAAKPPAHSKPSPTRKATAKKPASKRKAAPRGRTAGPTSRSAQAPTPLEPAAPVVAEVPSEAPAEAEQMDVLGDPGQSLIDLMSQRAQDAQSQATAAGLALELIAGMNVNPGALPRIIEQLVEVLKQLEPNSLPQFVAVLQGVLQEPQLDEN
ncbi:MAG TPA: hypothetical protein VFZ58_04190 [Candidatus Saccharimonadales bacterium]